MALTIDLALGFIGTVTGVLSLIIIAIKYLKDRPHIVIEINGNHNYSADNKLKIWGKILIRNHGKRGLDISRVTWRFMFPGAKHAGDVVAQTVSKKTERVIPGGNHILPMTVWDVFVLGEDFKEKLWIKPYGVIEFPIIRGVLGTPRDVIEKREEIELRCDVYCATGMLSGEGWSRMQPPKNAPIVELGDVAKSLYPYPNEKF